ncbi:MAG: sensor domain-containing diguanylate cyclase [Blastocatellia bacterium]
MESERKVTNGARVAVFATEETTQTLRSVLDVLPATEIHALPWPPSGTITELSETASAPDLIVCEIGSELQARDHQRELGRLWPETMLVSCEKGLPGFDRGTGSLLLASREAGYHGHVLINEAALHLPFFLRYAAQRRQNEARLRQLERILNAFSQILISLDLQRVASRIIEEFSRQVQADAWLLYTVAEDGQSLELVLAEGMRVRPHSLNLTLHSSGPGNTALPGSEMKIITQGNAGEISVAIETLSADESVQQSSVLCLPLTVESRAIGVIEAIRHHGGFEKPDSELLGELSRIASIALNNALRYERAERMYMQDDLTRLYNSRYLRQFIEREIKRAKRYGSQFSVVFIDVDGFKEVNDSLGHRVGSETLCEIAELLTSSVRDTDVVARYGGDEFTIVLPETGAELALSTAERIRVRMAEMAFSGGSRYSFRLTASFGVAAFPTHAENAVDLLEKADLAMYEAKAVGKNQVKSAK